jgi:hypothetical protein
LGEKDPYRSGDPIAEERIRDDVSDLREIGTRGGWDDEEQDGCRADAGYVRAS